MHDLLRQRLIRKIESLPEDQVYQVFDYIEFLQSKYARQGMEEEVSGIQRFAERLEDGLRRRTVSPSAVREAFQLLAAADRVLSGIATAGRDLLSESGPRPDGPKGDAGPEARGSEPGVGLP